jgi:hypothetical protein
MQTREIPPNQWRQFFDDFSKRHDGWIVDLEVVGREIGDQQEVNDLPLVGITADVKGSERRLEITAGKTTDSHVTHIIDRPRRVWVKQPGESIEIEAEDGTKTIVSFEQVAPEQTERQLPEEATKGRR